MLVEGFCEVRYGLSTIKNYKGFIIQFDEFCKAMHKRYDFGDIDLKFYDDFVAYFTAKDYSINTIGRLIKELKIIMRAAREEGLHDNGLIESRKFRVLTAEERALKERRQANLWSFETYPCKEATLDDLKLDLFKNIYLPAAVDEDVLTEDKRDIKEQMAALRLYSLKEDCPTYAAILLFGKRPEYYLPGAYVQYVRFKGEDNAADIVNEHKFSGCLLDILPKLDTFIETAIVEKSPKPISPLREKMVYNYPTWAIRELLMNAVMHRDYQSNTPIKFYQYQNRIEIDNAGGLYGNANKENFPNVNDYRNPVIAEAMKLLGYVNRYNRGIARVQKELRENGNGDATFSVANITVFGVNVADAAFAADGQLDLDFANKTGDSNVASNIASKKRYSKEQM